jgi:hypothetical protein
MERFHNVGARISQERLDYFNRLHTGILFQSADGVARLVQLLGEHLKRADYFAALPEPVSDAYLESVLYATKVRLNLLMITTKGAFQQCRNDSYQGSLFFSQP